MATVVSPTLKFDGVFEGGGVKGIGLVGALDYLEGQGYQPVNLAGTSAGAIVAALRAAGYAPAELKTIIAGLDFRKFEDTSMIGRIPIAGPIINVLDRLGIYKGDYFLELMRGLLRKKGVTTFKDLVIPETADDPKYRYRLRVVASDITKGCMLVLPQDLANYGIGPDDFEVALAVRMSMSIPVFFRPVKFKSGEGKQHTVVDGGVLSNFPVELFDSAGEPAWPTFGFRLTQPGPPPMERYQISGPVSMLAALFGTMMEAHDARYIETHNFVRSITIDPKGVATTQFDLGDAQKGALYQSGRDSAKDFLAHWDFEAYKLLFRSGSPSPNRRELSLPIPAGSTGQK
jgi:NTE family protein